MIKKDCKYYYQKRIEDNQSYGSIVDSADFEIIDRCEKNNSLSFNCENCSDYQKK